MRCARRAVIASLVAVAMGLGPASPEGRAGRQDAPRQSTFRAGASGVAVDVAVRDRTRRPLTNLAAADFEVLDNGVPQEVASVSYGRVPIDVTVALDVSFSVTGTLLNQLRRGVADLMGDLRSDDRLKLVLFNTRVSRTVDFTRDVPAVERAIQGARAGGGTSLHDAISIALVSASAPDRRQLLVVFTDGRDTSSTTPPDLLLRVAARTRPTLSFVMPIGPGQGTFNSVFSALARETGGSIVPMMTGANLSSLFRRALDDFRSAYVLYYNARGVDRAGYHTIEVRVVSSQNLGTPL